MSRAGESVAWCVQGSGLWGVCCGVCCGACGGVGCGACGACGGVGCVVVRVVSVVCNVVCGVI